MNNAIEGSAGANGGTIFRRNVGGIDRVVRVAAGAILFATGLLRSSQGNSYALGLIILGLFVMAMAGIGFCPLYLPFGVSTARGRQSRTMGE